MPSPDLRPFVDLTVFDATAEDLARMGIAVLAAQVPGWVPSEANIETLTLEAHAEVAAEIVFAVNRVPGAVLETLLRLFGQVRSMGTGPVATATFGAPDTLGYTIPAGTRLRFDLGAGADPIDFALDADAVIDPGDSSVAAAISSPTPTTAANGVIVGTPLTPLDHVPGPVTLATVPAGGSDPEDGPAFLARATEILSRLTDTLVLPAHFTYRAVELIGVGGRALTIDNYDGTGTVDGADIGHVTVAVYGPGADGTGLTDDDRTAIAAALDAQALASLTIHVIDPTINDIDATITVHVLPGADETAVTAAIQAAVTAYLDPSTWPWSNTLRRNELIALVDGVAGVDYVADVVISGAGGGGDLTLLGDAASLTRAGTLAVAFT